MNPEEHGKEMMSSEIEGTVPPNNQPGQAVETTTCLLVSFADGTKMTLDCVLGALDDRRIEIAGVPAATGVTLYKKFKDGQCPPGCFVLKTYGLSFVTPPNLSVYGFFDDLCAVSFTGD